MFQIKHAAFHLSNSFVPKSSDEPSSEKNLKSRASLRHQFTRKWYINECVSGYFYNKLRRLQAEVLLAQAAHKTVADVAIVIFASSSHQYPKILLKMSSI